MNSKWSDIVRRECVRGTCHSQLVGRLFNMSLGVRRLSRPNLGQSETDTTVQTTKDYIRTYRLTEWHFLLLGGSGGIRTHASEETGALNQRLRPLGHATFYRIGKEKLRQESKS